MIHNIGLWLTGRRTSQDESKAVVGLHRRYSQPVGSAAAAVAQIVRRCALIAHVAECDVMASVQGTDGPERI